MKASIALLSTFIFSLAVLSAPVTAPMVRSTKAKVTTDAAPATQDSTSTANLQDMPEVTNSTYTPSSVYINNEIIGLATKTAFLAPAVGTEFAVNMTASELNFKDSEYNSKFSSKLSHRLGSMTLAHALSPQLFLSANLVYGQTELQSESSFGNQTNSNQSKAKGLADPIFTVGGRVNTAADTTALLALSARVATGDERANEVSNRESRGNIKKGGNSLIPSVTIYKDLSNILVGSTLAYEINAKSKSKYISDSGETFSTEEKGENIQTISVFAEVPRNKMSFGTALEYTKKEGGMSETTIDGFQDKFDNEQDALSFVTATGFANIELNNQVNIIPSFSYGRFGEGATSIDTKNIYTARVMAKTTF